MNSLKTITEELHSKLCHDFVRGIAHRGMRSFIVTNFHYPDGDLVNLYVSSEGQDTWLTDMGTTIFKMSNDGVTLTAPRLEFIQTMCNVHGLRLENSIISKRLNFDVAGTDCLTFCEGVLKISTLQYDRASRQKSELAEQVDSLLDKRVKPFRSIERKWTNSKVDHNESFPVDIRLNGVGDPRHIFHISNSDKSNLVSAVCNFFKAKGVYAPTLSIIDPDIELGPHYLDRIRQASTQIRFGVDGSEDAIVEFALEGMKSSASN